MEYYEDEEDIESGQEEDIDELDCDDKDIDVRCQHICELYNRVIRRYRKGDLAVYVPNVMTDVDQKDFLGYVLRTSR